MKHTAQSLILDLLSASLDHSIPVRLLVPAGELFGIKENNIRVVLARLVARGLVVRGERGQYRLAEGAWPVQRHVASWASMEDRTAAWKGGWVGVHLSSSGRRGSKSARRQRALAFMGFGRLFPGLAIRPDNLAGGVSELRARLGELGLDKKSPVFGVSELDEETERAARGLWDIKALERSYQTLQKKLERSSRQLEKMSPKKALVESFITGGEVLHRLAFDPLLPEEILSPVGRRGLIEEMRRYDRVGREHWDRFARLNGAPELALPMSSAVNRGNSPLRAEGGAE